MFFSVRSRLVLAGVVEGCGCCSVLLGARLPLGIVGCGASLVFVFEKADFMSINLYLKSGNGLSDVLLVFALGVGAFGAGLTTVGFWVGAIVMVFAFGLTKCLSLVSLSMRGARLPLPLPLACLLVPLAGESPKSKSEVRIFFFITMSLLRIIAALQKVSVEFDCSIILKSYLTKRGFPDPL